MPKFLHNFSEYNDGTIVDNGWWKIDGCYITNLYGGRQAYEPSDDDIIVEADDITNLDWSCLLKPDSIFGFIDRNGKHYSCDYGEHRLFAQLYLKSNERCLEIQGWVKIYRNYNRQIEYYYENNLTNAQILTLENLGILREEDRIY